MKKSTLASVISSALLVSACGGGSTNPPTDSSGNYTLKGTVPGTLIEAYCDDGSTYSVSSTKNGTAEHPFEIKLPTTLVCRVVMVTNEDDAVNKVITPIKFIDADGKSSIAITSSADSVDVGHVDLSLTREGMKADDNNDGVEDHPKEVTVDDGTLTVVVKANDPLDKDNDGIPNIYEDDDGDGVPNHDDDDDDGDGIKDIDDNDHNNDGVSDDDLDGDGIKNNDDVDDDNDGIKDKDDDDDDNDGIKDDKDDDDDNDGIKDKDDDNHDDDDGKRDDDQNLTVRSAKKFTLPTTYVADATGGRQLTAQCAQCHGTNGYSVSRIDSLSKEWDEIVEEMAEMSAESNNHIMKAQAKGYTVAEARSISNYMRQIVSKYGRK